MALVAHPSGVFPVFYRIDPDAVLFSGAQRSLLSKGTQILTGLESPEYCCTPILSTDAQ